MAILGFHHVGISTPDIDRLTAFYRDVIGFEVIFETAWDAGVPSIDAMMEMDGVGARVVMLRTGNCFLELFAFSSPEPRDTGRRIVDFGLNHICLVVDDAAAECRRLADAGVRLHGPPPPPKSAAAGSGAAVALGLPISGAYGRDPDGNVIEILEIMDPDFPMHFANRRLARYKEVAA